ncbi:phosphonate ABC transporter substrate-binding protein [Ramlibacter sp.]|uniref:phosphonate ABC transporter substrate-binding protein n=1 Tax=Ramlibacter sp. TaxID=1917967 RepID=UPI001815D6D2|nr:phosphonate ABC transporter substrate-binding protein [Ramlibacter sp.]MBA2673904.1 phosphonate ABC transporter substrate-binding protein [Ramlibacter sp.]
MFKQFALGTALLAAAGTAPAQSQSQSPKEINFGIISTESSQNLKQDWAPLLADMEKRTGLKVNAFFAPDYAGVIEAMRFGKVQVGWFGNKSAIEAVDRAGGEVFAQVVNVDGSIGYNSMVSVHKDSPYKTLDELLKNAKSLSFGIGDPNSTSGYLVPSYYIFAKYKLDPKTTFKNTRGANHETNILAVANKQVDAAVHSSDVLERIEKRQPEVAAKVRVIWKSPLIAGDPLVWRKDLDADSKAKVKQFMLSYGKGSGAEGARELAILTKLTLGGFRDSGNAQLSPTRQLELFREKTKLEADAGMGAQEKAGKIEAIDKKLAELQQAG